MLKKYFFNILSSKITFFLIPTIIILALNLTPLVTFIKNAPPGRTFALIHNNTQDYFFYQSLMSQGASGALMTSDPYTSEPHRPSIIFSYFLLFGKISSLLSIPYSITYHLIRITASILLLFSVYYLLFNISIPYRRLCFLFFIFASPLMHNINENGKIISVPFMNWWTGMDPIRRAAYLPHHMIGALLLVLSIILIIKYFRNHKLKYLVELLILLLPLSFIHPPSLLLLLLILPSSIIIHSFLVSLNLKISNIEARNPKQIANHKSQFSKQSEVWGLYHWNLFRISPACRQGRNLGFRIYDFIGLFVYWVIGIFLLIFMVSQTNQGFPWSQYISWEKRLQFPLSQEIIGALGILFPLSVIGAIKAIWSKRFEYIFIACWLFVPLLLIPVAPSVNLSNIRLIQGLPYLPLAILAVLGIDFIIKFLNKFFGKISKFEALNPKQITNPKSQFSKLFGIWDLKNWNLFRVSSFEFRIFNNIDLFVYLLIGLLFIIFTYPTLRWSLKDQIREYAPIFGNVYFDNRLHSAFAFINQNYPPKTITLSTFYTGNYLPSFTHTVSFIGHFGYTYKIDEKDKMARKFFENKMTDQEAKDLIMNNKITLVIQGPEEKPIYNNYLYPNILKPVYDKEEMTIYVLR